MKKVVWVVLCLFFLCSSEIVKADWRRYVWTYEYMTMQKGKAEIEYYMTVQVPDLDESSTNTWKHWVELEYGITDHWDVAMYQRLKQTNTEEDSDFQYDGFKIRTRYRFGEKGQFIIDPLVYLEWIRDDDFSKSNVLEGKIILAKDINKFNVAYNQIIKQEITSGGETEHEYAAGVNYRVLPYLRIGVESKGNYSEDKYYVGPTISYAYNHKFWTALGVLFGLNDDSDDLQSRLIVGIPF